MTMDIVKTVATPCFWGVVHSFKGFTSAFRLDQELNKRRLSRLSPPHSHSPIRRKEDARDPTPIRTLPKEQESKILSKLFLCVLLNGIIFLCSILIFEYIFLIVLKYGINFLFGKDSMSAQAVWYYIEIVMRVAFQTLWVVPLFAISKIINLLWFQDIGQSAYKSHKNRSTSLGFSKTIADTIFSTVVETLFLLQALFVSYFPITGLCYIFYLLYLSLLYSLYAFEYKWSEMGWEVHKRLTCIEIYWPYFIGFGLPLVILTQLSDSVIISGCIFSIFFPFYIISANESNPIPGTSFRLRIFSPVVALSNTIFIRFGQLNSR